MLILLLILHKYLVEQIILYFKEWWAVWSYNGQLGIGNNHDQHTLQQVKGVNGVDFITNITQILAGYENSLFLNNKGKVFSCGRNSEGQLGIGNNYDQHTLQQVKGVNGVDFHVHTYYVLIKPPMPIYYVLAAVFASCFYVLFKFAS